VTLHVCSGGFTSFVSLQAAETGLLRRDEVTLRETYSIGEYAEWHGEN
jgi:hypothetical protein